MPKVANRNRFLPVCIMHRGREVFWGPRPKVWPLTGRERRPPMPADALYGGRHVSPVGNPFHRESFGDDAIPLYRVWLAIVLGTLDPAALDDWPGLCARYGIASVDDHRPRAILDRAAADEGVRDRVMRWMRSVGPDTLLVCSCAPGPCHLDVALRAWGWLCESGAIDPFEPLRETPDPDTL